MEQAQSKVRKVAEQVYVVHLPLPMPPRIVNVTLIGGGDEWALVDTGVNTTESVDALLSAMSQVGCAPDQVKKIIVTHHHPDHFGAAAECKKRFPAPVYIHHAEHESAVAFQRSSRGQDVIDFFDRHGIPRSVYEDLSSPAKFWAKLYVPAAPDYFLEDGQEIRVGELRLVVVTTPGHTRGHCVICLPDLRMMIAGDHLLPKITPHVGCFPGGPENPLGDFIESQRKIQRLDIDRVLPAHGGVFSGHRRRSKQIIDHHEHRLKEIQDILTAAPHTAYGLARKVFNFDLESPLTIQFPATFEALAHLELLRIRGAAAIVDEGDRTLYSIL